MNSSNVYKTTLQVMSLSLILSSKLVFANSGGETFVEGINYLPIKPPIVVNYGGPGNSGKVKYIKAEISLRVEDAHAAAEVSHHMPLIRDTLIMLLSSVTDQQLSSGEGKDEIRTEALEKVNEAIEAQITAGMPKRSKKSTHGKSENAKDEQSKADEHSKSERPKRPAKKSPAANGPVSDLLFDNLIMQK